MIDYIIILPTVYKLTIKYGVNQDRGAVKQQLSAN